MWIPCSALDELEGLPWLRRMIEKARRVEAGRAAGTDLMNGYLYGDNDFIDAQLLTFLRLRDAEVSAIVREHPDDRDAAHAIVQRSGRRPDEIGAFAKRFRRKNMDFFLTEADEGRRGDGVGARLTSVIYNRLMMPIVYRKFAADERKRASSG